MDIVSSGSPLVAVLIRRDSVRIFDSPERLQELQLAEITRAQQARQARAVPALNVH